MKNLTQSLKVIVLATMLSFGISFVYAWTAPTQTPPNGNVSAPINTSVYSQYKSADFSDTSKPERFGTLGIEGLIRGYSGAIFDGSVGIGTGETVPASKLEIKSTLDEILRLTRDGGNYPTIFKQGEDDTLVINNNNKDALTIKGDNVGIGMPHKYFYKGGSRSVDWIAPRCQCDTSTNESWLSCNNFYTNTDEGAICYDQYKAGMPFYTKYSQSFNRENAPPVIYTAGRGVSIDGAAALNSTLNVTGQSTLNASLNVEQNSTLKGDVIVGNEINSSDRVYKTKTLTSSGTFDIPATGVTKVTVTMNGGGGAGGDGSNHDCYGGGGGGGGASVSKRDVSVLAGESITVTVGGGGTDCGDKCATNGGDSSFGNYITTYGGKAGSPGKAGTGGAAGGEGGTNGANRNSCTGGAGGSSSFGSGGGGGRGGDGYKGGAGGGAGYVFVEWYQTTTPLFGASKLRVNGESLFLADKKIDDNTSSYYVSNKRYHVEASKAKADNTRNTVPLDMTVVNDLCKDEDGCSVTVGMRNWDSTGKPGAVATRGPYKFFISKTSDWWRLSNDAEAKDGNGTVNHIIDAWSCLLTDGEYISGTMTDSSVQLGLLNANRAGYTDTNMVCLLTIDD